MKKIETQNTVFLYQGKARCSSFVFASIADFTTHKRESTTGNSEEILINVCIFTPYLFQINRGILETKTYGTLYLNQYMV